MVYRNKIILIWTQIDPIWPLTLINFDSLRLTNVRTFGPCPLVIFSGIISLRILLPSTLSFSQSIKTLLKHLLRLLNTITNTTITDTIKAIKTLFHETIVDWKIA